MKAKNAPARYMPTEQLDTSVYNRIGKSGFPSLDLVEEMDWEDNEAIQWVSLEEAGLEEPHHEPVFGLQDSNGSSIEGYVEWWLEEDSALQLH